MGGSVSCWGKEEESQGAEMRREPISSGRNCRFNVSGLCKDTRNGASQKPKHLRAFGNTAFGLSNAIHAM